MTKSLSIAATGMLAQQLNVEVIANNIANLNTTGYKRQRAEFQDLLYENQVRVGSTSSDQGTVVPAGIQLGSPKEPGNGHQNGPDTFPFIPFRKSGGAVAIWFPDTLL